MHVLKTNCWLFAVSTLFYIVFYSEFASQMESRGPIRRAMNRSQSNTDVGNYERTDGSMSDSAVSSSVTEGRKRRPSISMKVAALVGLSRKSNSASQLGITGRVPASTDNPCIMNPIKLGQNTKFLPVFLCFMHWSNINTWNVHLCKHGNMHAKKLQYDVLLKTFTMETVACATTVSVVM